MHELKTKAQLYLDSKMGSWVGGQVLGAVICVVLLAIGSVIAFSILTNINRSGFSTAANNTLTNLATGTQSAWAIGNLLPLVLLAVAIIGAVMGIMAYSRGR